MRAIVLNKIGPIESSPLKLSEVPIPVPAENEIRVKIKCCAVCRTDLHIVEGDISAPRLPLIPGHQIVGIVDQLGSNARAFKIGDRVGIAWLRHTCGTCRFCTRGRENLCEFSKYTGFHADGGYAEYAVAPEAYVHRLPKGFDDTNAAPLLCAGIIGFRSLERSLVKPGGRLAIFGFGSSAHIIIQIALARGCEVYVVSRSANHQQMARDLGASWVGEAEEMPKKATGAIVFAPAGPLVLPALECVDRGSAVALAGIHMTRIPEMDYDRYLFNEREVRSVTSNTRDDARRLLSEAAKVPVKPLTRIYRLEEANQALQDLKGDRIAGTAILQIGEAKAG